MATLESQIEIDPRGVAWVSGTRIKVVEIVLDKITHGWSPEEIHFQHPDLSPSQIYSALAFYYENQCALDAQIRENFENESALMKQVSDPAFRRRLAGLRTRA